MAPSVTLASLKLLLSAISHWFIHCLLLLLFGQLYAMEGSADDLERGCGRPCNIVSVEISLFLLLLLSSLLLVLLLL